MEIEFDIRSLQRELGAIGSRRIPSVGAKALNRTGHDARKHLEKKAEFDFDRPTQRTLDAFAVKHARASDGMSMKAVVFVKKLQAQWLWYGIVGDVRRPGDFRTLGPRGSIVPATGSKRNRYGSMPRGFVSRQLRTKSHRWLTLGGLEGLWKKLPKRQQTRQRRYQLVAFVSKNTHYDPIFPFYAYVRKEANRVFADNFRNAWNNIP